MTALKLYANEAEINKAVTSFAKAGVKLQEEAHKIACSVLKHVGEFRDIHVVRRFLDAMPECARSNALRKWFETYGPVTFDQNVAYFNKAGRTRLGEAMDKPFWKLKAKEGEDYEPVDPNALILALVKKLEKDALKTGRDHRATIHALRYVPIYREEEGLRGDNVPAPLLIEGHVVH